MTYERPPTSNQCAICGQPATCSTLKDPWGKSDEMEGRCAKHSPKLRDPDDVALIDRQRAEIERLTRERDEAVTGYSVRDAEVTGLLARCAQHDKEITAFCAERDRLRRRWRKSRLWKFPSASASQCLRLRLQRQWPLHPRRSPASRPLTRRQRVA